MVALFCQYMGVDGVGVRKLRYKLQLQMGGRTELFHLINIFLQ